MASVLITPRYSEALQWAADLHHDQLREGKNVPYLLHVIAVSSLVWEDRGRQGTQRLGSPARRPPRSHLLEAGRAGLEVSPWYFKRLEHELKRRLPGSRSVERLGRAVEGILALTEFLCLLPPGSDPMEWALAYEQRLNALVGTALTQPQEHAGEPATASTGRNG